jgi:hypothetical protein
VELGTVTVSVKSPLEVALVVASVPPGTSEITTAAPAAQPLPEAVSVPPGASVVVETVNVPVVGG